MPRVSVVMSVYNGREHVGAAVASILAQTFTDFEFIIVDDGSSDDTAEILAQYDDPRLRIIHQADNQGLTRSLNRGLAAATGEFIARQDADDIAWPDRLARQVEYLDAHPEILLLGGGCSEFFGAAPPAAPAATALPEDRGATVIPFEAMLRRNWLAHGTTMFRRHLVDAGLTYREAFTYSQDYDLWLRVCQQGGVAKLNRPVCFYRRSAGMISLAHIFEQFRYAEQARLLAQARQGRNADELDRAGRLPEVPPARDRELRRLACDTLLDFAFKCCRSRRLGDTVRLVTHAFALAPLLSLRSALALAGDCFQADSRRRPEAESPGASSSKHG